jgi:hypothetical protein
MSETIDQLPAITARGKSVLSIVVRSALGPIISLLLSGALIHSTEAPQPQREVEVRVHTITACPEPGPQPEPLVEVVHDPAGR